MDPKQNGKKFSKRIYYPRIAGTLLCTPIIFDSIIHSEQFTYILIALLLNALVWPHLAYKISTSAQDPYSSEIQNLSFDSFFCGLWISVIGLNSFGSISMSAMVILNTICTGGLKFMRKGITLQILGIFLHSIIFGITLQEDSMSSAWASLPLLTIYPNLVGFSSYKLASELQKTKIALNSLSITDSLTGLLNRRQLDKTLLNFTKSSTHSSNTLLVLMDIDNFKKINDTYGHDIGDEVLCLFSNTLKNSLRPTDLIARFGGDEFCIIMSDTSQNQAIKIITRIQHTFRIKSHETLNEPLSVSAGVAKWDDDFENADQWFTRADKLLYKAKKNGRDRAEIVL
ncbi:diguanylate cyclase [Pseudomonas sp. SIMBA_059]